MSKDENEGSNLVKLCSAWLRRGGPALSFDASVLLIAGGIGITPMPMGMRPTHDMDRGKHRAAR